MTYLQQNQIELNFDIQFNSNINCYTIDHKPFLDQYTIAMPEECFNSDFEPLCNDLLNVNCEEDFMDLCF